MPSPGALPVKAPRVFNGQPSGRLNQAGCGDHQTRFLGTGHRQQLEAERPATAARWAPRFQFTVQSTLVELDTSSAQGGLTRVNSHSGATMIAVVSLV